MTEKEIRNEFERELRDVRRMRKAIKENEGGRFGTEREANDLLRDLNRKWVSKTDEFRRQAHDARQDHLKSVKKKVFNLPGQNGRHAVEVANGINKESLEKEYDRADMRGDESLKSAIMSRAFFEGKGDLLEKYANEFPQNRKEVDELREAQRSASDTMSLQNEFTSYGNLNVGGDESWLDE